jgi:rod shape-determining protein MreC
MPVLSNNRTNVLILVVLLFGQLLLMSGSAKQVEGAGRAESLLMRVSSPIVGLAQAVGGGVRGAAGAVGDLWYARSRNTELEAELARLRGELALSREAELENIRLRQLLGMRDNLAPRSIGATVITSNLTGRAQLIVVDRGEQDGVRADLPVVAWGGAVGRVVETAPGRSKVRLLTDPNAGVAGVVQRSRAQGVIVGRGRGPLDLLYVPRFSDVAPGDRVVTSGLDGIFPRGFGVGRVVAINENADGSQTLRLDPELDYRLLEEVLILLEPVGGDLLAPPEPAEEGS